MIKTMLGMSCLGLLACGQAGSSGPERTSEQVAAGTLVTLRWPELRAPGYEFDSSSLKVQATPLGKVSFVMGGLALIQRGESAADYVALQRSVDTTSASAIAAAFLQRTPQRVPSLIDGLELITYGESLPAEGTLMLRRGSADGEHFAFQVLTLQFASGKGMAHE